MISEATRQVRDGLATLIRRVNDGSVPTAEARALLRDSKGIAAQVAVLQADSAALVAAGERHGDGGAGVLARAAGMSRRDAASQVKTAERLQSMPAVRDAVESGGISMANAKLLAGASEKTSSEQVARDASLLEKAAELSPEQFAREAGRWAAQRQDDGGEGEYRRQRARRRLSIWNGDDGMVHLRGELVIPQSVLEEQFCNAKIFGVVYSSKGSAAVAGPGRVPAHASPDGRADRALRRLRGMWRALRDVPSPSHPAQIAGRPH